MKKRTRENSERASKNVGRPQPSPQHGERVRFVTLPYRQGCACLTWLSSLRPFIPNIQEAATADPLHRTGHATTKTNTTPSPAPPLSPKARQRSRCAPSARRASKGPTENRQKGTDETDKAAADRTRRFPCAGTAARTLAAGHCCGGAAVPSARRRTPEAATAQMPRPGPSSRRHLPPANRRGR